MGELENLMAKIAKENQADEAKRPAPEKDRVEQEAKFLKRWPKGKPIVRQTADATFWAAGKWMTKLDFKMANALV
ncbi:hypothetical protein, partial [Klebsiella aerogenes]|uniref:hypothetical protein n=1 Tax=Klebsiella aerogenes TaxID=548 RepID=UPI001CC6D5F1